MDQKTTRLNFPLRDIKGLWLLLFCVVLTAVPSCKDDDDLLRKDFLIVSDSLTREPVSAINCRVDEGRDTLYVHANVPYEMFFQTSDEESDWLTYENKGFNAEAKADMIILSYKPMGEFYKRRSGTLSFTSSDKYLGAFVTVNQGFGTLLCEDFSWLNYGYDYPWDAEDERRIDKWTTTQKNYGWTSTEPESTGYPALYGRIGWVKLGDTKNGGDLITPNVTSIIVDSLVMLRFRAVGFCEKDGTKDANLLHVSVIGGGAFKGGKTTQTLELGYYDPSDPDVVSSMWDDSDYVLYLVNTETNPFTGHTQIRFAGGDAELSGGRKNRVFLDNVQLYALDAETYYQLNPEEKPKERP